MRTVHCLESVSQLSSVLPNTQHGNTYTLIVWIDAQYSGLFKLADSCDTRECMRVRKQMQEHARIVVIMAC